MLRYHGKCLKIARGKVKDDDKYTCPICDWRVKIPRDAARPNAESLISWYEEIPGLPFQPEEEPVLKKIINNAQDFRNHIAAYCNPILATASEAETQRFYLRKIEGAEILLAHETNFFRQELHKWSPVAPEPPPMIEDSKSTRKPRPTKLQKLLHQYGVEDPDELPDDVRGRASSLRRRPPHPDALLRRSPALIAPAVSPSSRGFGQGSHPLLSHGSSSRPPTPGLSVVSSSHGHPSRGPDSSASSQAHGHGQGPSDSNSASAMRQDVMDIDSVSSCAIHPSFLMQDGAGGDGPILVGSSMSLEDRLLRGDMEDEDDSDVDKERFLEILSQTEEGRRRAEEIYGPGVWSGILASDNLGQNQQDEGDVDRMFTDLVNQDDDDDAAPSGKKAKDSDTNVDPEDLENERNGMDALLDGD